MNLLITGAWKYTPEIIDQIRKMGHIVTILPNEKDEMSVPCEDIEGTICNGLFLHYPIKKFINLKYIQLTSAGFDRVPMEYVKAHNIEIHNARGVYSTPMAEFAVSGVLQLYKQSQFFYENQMQHKWEKHRGLLELMGKTVCIVGCGSVGIECAKRFSAFGCVVIGVDIYPPTTESFEKIYPLEELDTSLEQSDIVVLTLPLTDDTRHIVNAYRFGVMKENSVLVNIARGAVIDTVALAEALKKKLFGAVLDVFEEEPLDVDSALWNMRNAIITPHNSFIGDNNAERLSKLIMTNLGVEE